MIHHWVMTNPPMTATASGSLKPVISVSTSRVFAENTRRTGEVVEVGFLVELIEDRPGPELKLGRGKDGDAVMWEFLREGCAAVMVLESGDPRCH